MGEEVDRMSVISMKQLLEAGVHFGHQTRRWNPKMAQYIFTERNGIYIIDLQKTVKKVEEAYEFVRSIVSEGKNILFVGTKKQAQETIKDEAERCGMFYVNVRWLGGTLTNYKTIQKRIQRLKDLEAMETNGTFAVLPKKEVAGLIAEREKLQRFLGGIKNMPGLPGAVFVIDPRKEHIAVAEARRLGIPIIAIVDTNCDPDEVDYVIPGNDDAIRAVKLLTSKIAEAVLEANQGQVPNEVDEPERSAEPVATVTPKEEAEKAPAIVETAKPAPAAKTESKRAEETPKTVKAEKATETAGQAESVSSNEAVLKEEKNRQEETVSKEESDRQAEAAKAAPAKETAATAKKEAAAKTTQATETVETAPAAEPAETVKKDEKAKTVKTTKKAEAAKAGKAEEAVQAAETADAQVKQEEKAQEKQGEEPADADQA